ncbi:pro-neuregulin-4, membrane-bound isoform-like [Xyrauchen texanus]|uniref:pro-neuregulin-4, membrane-bound isoform-like n=1 Tax=Xyrauchen texanus TaxID=154827 RepID=UPI00224266B2|nr:pro-neuregulin-4, membrane-bound isoform-like [Xyrauchen texanus]
MMAEHGDPCTGLEATYCMNGGTCFRIPTVSTPTCVCGAHYDGSRCEQFQLLSFSHSIEEKGMIAGVVILLLLIIMVVGVVIYYNCKMKRAARSQPKPAEEYRRVNSNV